MPELGQRFQPCSDIEPVAEDVAIFDDNITHFDADAEFDPFRDTHSRIARGQCLLYLAGAAHGVNHARELDEQSIAGGLEQATVMRRDLRVDHLGTDRPYPAEGSLLVGADQARISRDIRYQDGRQPALRAIRVHSQNIDLNRGTPEPSVGLNLTMAGITANKRATASRPRPGCNCRPGRRLVSP
jgi:hypothetical protein